MTAVLQARQLREGTRRAHRALDRHSLLQPLVKPGLTRSAYTRALLAMYCPHVRLEACVMAGARRFGLTLYEDGGESTRSGRLEADLALLGVTPLQVSTSTLPLATTPAALAGQYYVLEGSRLGGQVIVRQVRLALGATVPVAFFGSPQPQAHWQQFLAFLDAHCPPEAIPEAVAAAQQAFADYLSALPNE